MTPTVYRRAYLWAAIWICFCAWCQIIPWILTAVGQLNRLGYLVAIVVSLPLLWWVAKRHGSRPSPAIIGPWRRWRRRAVRQPVFAVWLVLLVAAFVGGVVYPPTNHDGLTYRFPRLLHWFGEGGWHWISNPAEPQMNLSTHGFEWLMGFLFGLTGTDRLFFLVNLISFALLPGLLFAFLTRVGIAGRVASWWMWIFPCGYGLALQAGSIGNDLFAIPYVLAGMVFALRARETESIRDVVLAILAAALITGTKLSNAPLVLPIGVALFSNVSWVIRWRHAPALFGATVTGLIASAAPVMIACTLYTGHFSGDPDNSKNLNVGNPAAGFVANSLQVTSRNLMPPINPMSGWWNAHYREWIPDSLARFLEKEYPRFHLNWSELPQEEGDGLGLGLSFLAFIGLGAAGLTYFRRQKLWSVSGKRVGIWVVYAAIAAALLVYFVKMGSEAAPRLMLPYYAVLLALFLAFDANGRLVRRRWWQATATVMVLFVFPAVILSPNRPLIPVRPLIARLPQTIQERSSVQRIATVYATYADRHDAMAPLRAWLPADSAEPERIGFIGDGRSLRTGIWRPFGTRKIETVSPHLEPEIFRASGFDAMVVDLSALESDDIENWARSRGFQVAGIESISNYAGKPPERYAVLLPVSPKLVAAESKEDSTD